MTPKLWVFVKNNLFALLKVSLKESFKPIFTIQTRDRE